MTPKSDLPDGDSKSDDKSTSLRDNGVYFLSDEITASSVKPAIEWILEENYRKRHKRLTLIVASPGGGVWAGFSLCDVMAGSDIPIDTLGLGCIASMGLTIFLFGDKRTITPNTYILSHQYSWWADGKHHELVASRKSQDWMGDRMLTIYAGRTGLTKDRVKEVLMGPSDTHLTAAQAVEYGIAHEIKLNRVT